MKAKIGLNVDSELIIEAKKEIPNISAVFNDFLMDYLAIKKKSKDLENLIKEEERLKIKLAAVKEARKALEEIKRFESVPIKEAY